FHESPTHLQQRNTARLRVGGSVISRLASRHRTTGAVRDRPRRGAPRVTDRNDDQYLRTYALRHRNASATELQAHLRDVRGTRVSRQTICNRLHRFGLNARRPLQVTPLTPRHHRERLQWAQDHVTWTMQQWSTFLFTDECRVNFPGGLCNAISGSSASAHQLCKECCTGAVSGHLPGWDPKGDSD
uniref:Transposase Tc1-like domain-containing protein n=1 Tax=Stegastes partitus TaxID=144197 RepID=A0A3B5ARU7_9TELE